MANANVNILNGLAPKRGSTGVPKRKGRGHATGQGGTAGKGHKGQRARTGGRVRWGFEGGQTPLMRRMPKFGFNNKDFRTEFQVVNLGQLNGLTGTVTVDTLVAAGIVKKTKGPVKLLAKGKLEKALIVQLHKVSDAARAAVEKVGGKVEIKGAQAKA